MSVIVRSFRTSHALIQFLASEAVPPGMIEAIEDNQSGHIELFYNSGAFAYDSGTGGGTVTVPADGAVLTITAHANGADGTFTIDGGAAITVRSGQSYSEPLDGKLLGEVDIVFSAALDYYVSWVA